MAEINDFTGGGRAKIDLGERVPMRPNIQYGLGVVATANGYEQAEAIEAYIPQPFDYAGLPKETFRYRQVSPNSPVAIDMRQKTAAQFALWESMMPNIVRGQE